MRELCRDRQAGARTIQPAGMAAAGTTRLAASGEKPVRDNNVAGQQQLHAALASAAFSSARAVATQPGSTRLAPTGRPRAARKVNTMPPLPAPE